MKRGREKYRKSAIRILEESVHLLRLNPVSLLSSYYTGTLPFILGLLYFWGDMSHNAFAAGNCAIASFGLSLLFIWMKCWQTVFTVRIRNKINNKTRDSWPMVRIFSLVTNQSLIHSTSFLVLPVSLILAFPFAWSYAFYQNVTFLSDERGYGVKATCGKAWEQAKQWPRQNHILLAIFFIFSIMVFLNLISGTLMIPFLLKTILGIDTVMSISGFSVFNSTFWMTMMAGTFLCVDPVVKTAYALRCYYGTAIRTGEDIRNELTRYAAIGVVCMILIPVFTPAPLHAQTHEYPAQSGRVDPDIMDRAIKETLKGREFTWRMPREKIAEQQVELPGPIEAVLTWMTDQLKRIGKKIKHWLDRFFEWIKDIFSSRKSTEKAGDNDWIPSARLFLIVLLVISVCFLLYFFWHVWKRRQIAGKQVISEVQAMVPDISDDDVVADELPVNKWLELARELTSKGSLRLAMRALYLGTLAHMADHELITIEKYKSNRDYISELIRRAHEKQNLISSFSNTVTVFERFWYGMYQLTIQDFNQFRSDQERIMTFAQES